MGLSGKSEKDHEPTIAPGMKMHDQLEEEPTDKEKRGRRYNFSYTSLPRSYTGGLISSKQ